MAKTIVIADDNVALANGIKDFVLQNEGYEVVGVAENGAQAVELVETLNPDFLLLDIVMPKLDGFGVLDAIHSKKTIVVMMSQLISDAFVQKAMRYGASYFLAKPFDCKRMLKDRCAESNKSEKT